MVISSTRWQRSCLFVLCRVQATVASTVSCVLIAICTTARTSVYTATNTLSPSVRYVFCDRPIAALGQQRFTFFNMAPISKRLFAEVGALQAQNELIIYALNRRRRRRCRRMWVRQIFLDRAIDRDFHNLFAKLRTGDTAFFYNFVRMSPQQFDFLESLLRLHIQVQETPL